MISKQNDIIKEVSSNNEVLKTNDIEIGKYKLEGQFKTKNKSFLKGRNNIMSNDNNSNISSKENLFINRNKLTLKNKAKTKNLDLMKENELIEANNNLNNESNLENNKKEEKKNIIRRGFDWMNYIIHEIPLLWKKEELVEGYDANGNIVLRPKKKIPTKKIQKQTKYEDIKDENDVNSVGVDYATKGLNYGVYFN